MISFEYASPGSVPDALPLLDTKWGPAEILAGGTDLVALVKDYVVTPRRVVNIKKITGISGVKLTAQKGLRIGALVTLDELAKHRWVSKYYPTLALAIGVALPRAQVLACFLDQDPLIEHVLQWTSRPLIIAVPFLIGGGDHADFDVPQRLGVPDACADGVTRARRADDKSVIIAAPLGEGPEFEQIVRRAIESALPRHAGRVAVPA